MNNPSHELVRIAIASAGGHKPKTPQDRAFILTFLSYHEFITPAFGTVKTLVGTQKMRDYCVIYLPGQPSQRMPLIQARDRHENEFAVMFKHDKNIYDGPYKKIRFYQIGSSRFWVNMSCPTWRMEEPRMVLSKIQHNQWDSKIEIPYFSIDFVRTDKIYAVDFDVNTGIRGTGIDTTLNHKQVIGLLKTANKKFNWPPEPIA